jgi:hypothetical protein
MVHEQYSNMLRHTRQRIMMPCWQTHINLHRLILAAAAAAALAAAAAAVAATAAAAVAMVAAAAAKS